MKKSLQVFFVLLTVISIFLFFYFDLDLYFNIKNIQKVKGFFEGVGNWALLYIILIHIILNITAVPRVFFVIFTGYVYGVFLGFLFSWIATLVGLIVTFIMVRYLFRQSFEHRFGSKKIVGKINKMVDKHGMWTVVFLRAIYIVPSSVLNYSFGFTKIKTSHYLVGSAIGFIPVVLFNVWAGNVLSNQIESSNGVDYSIIIIGIVLLGLVYILRRSSRFSKSGRSF
jgi:uncharacterized membrane protein YdjX (TVP38/TMEM64 family)